MKSATQIDFDRIRTLDEAIRKDSCRYHKSSFVYGVDALDDRELFLLKSVTDDCQRLAPACEAFIKAFYRQGDLGRVKVFTKHADAEPVKTKKLTSYYRNKSGEQGESLEAIFTRKSDEPNADVTKAEVEE